jgi:hypothetical protein
VVAAQVELLNTTIYTNLIFYSALSSFCADGLTASLLPLSGRLTHGLPSMLALWLHANFLFWQYTVLASWQGLLELSYGPQTPVHKLTNRDRNLSQA